MKNTFTTAFNRSVKSIRDVNTMNYTEPSKVKASLAYATDINKIYEDFCMTGKAPLNGATPIYDENFVSYDSLVEAHKLCSDAALYFSQLPARIKNEYGNDLMRFVKALNAKDDFLVHEGLLQLPSADPIKEDSTVPVSDVEPVQTVPESVNTAETA